MTRKAAKAVAWSVGGLVALLVVLYTLAVAVNWWDEAPSAAAQRFTELYATLPPVADDDNAHIYLLGLEAAASENPAEVGARRVAWLRAAAQVPFDQREPPPAATAARTGLRPTSVDQLLAACEEMVADCPGALAAAPSVVEQWSVAEPQLLARYRQLVTHTAWRDEVPGDVSLPLPSFSAAVDGQRFLLLTAYTAAVRGDAREVRELLTSDLRFWRMVLASTDMLITKMVATGALYRHFHWGNLVLRELEPGTAFGAVPAEWLSALADSERSMIRTMTGEWLHVSSALPMELDRMTSAEAPWPERAQAYLLAPLYQAQDTRNKFAEHYWALGQAFDAPLAQYAAALNRASVVTAEAGDDSVGNWLYNPLGRVMFMTVSDFASYAARVADIEGVRRAALAAVTLRAAGVAADDVGAALRVGDWRNPYDESALEWSPSDRFIVFRGLQPGERGEHRFAY